MTTKDSKGQEDSSRIRAQALHAAIDAADSVLTLCIYLGVSAEEFMGRVAGESAVPQRHFLRMVDIVCNDLEAIERKALAAAQRVTSDANLRRHTS